MNRRSFLHVAGATVAGLPLLSSFARTPAASAFAAGPDQRAAAPGKFALKLEGKVAGFVKSIEGGDAFGEVIEVNSQKGLGQKHIGNIRYSPIEITVGSDMGSQLLGWVSDFVSGQHSRKDGSIVVMDYEGNIISEKEFHHGLITEFGLPALDGSAKESAYFTIKILPEYTREGKGSGKLATPTVGIAKPAALSRFKLQIPGLETSCATVSKIDAMSVKLSVVPGRVGDTREAEIQSGKMTLPDLAFTVSQAASQDIKAWFDEFVIKGSGPGGERTATLQLVDASMNNVLFELRMVGVGIYKLAGEALEANSDNIRRLKATLFCEQMSIPPPQVKN